MIKSFVIIGILFSSLFATNCINSYNEIGCNEESFNVGSNMAIKQFQVLYDNDQDGVSDKLDKCPSTKIDTKVDKNGCKETITKKTNKKPIKKVKSITLQVNFATSKYNIPDSSYDKVNDFARYLMAHANYNAHIVGNTDSSGNENKNQVLSINRAKVVYNMLIDLGIEKSRLSYEGVGSSKPLESNDTVQGRATNRRTKVTLAKGNK